MTVMSCSAMRAIMAKPEMAQWNGTSERDGERRGAEKRGRGGERVEGRSDL